MRRTVVLFLAMSLAAAACGTRASDDDFDVAFVGDQEGPIRAADGGDLPPLAGGVSPDAWDGDLDPAQPDALGGSGTTGAQTGTASPTTSSPSGPSGSNSPAGAPSPGQPAQPAAPSGNGQSQAANTASDVGVTPTSIKVGNIVPRGGPLGPHQMTPAYFGANAYFQLVNARGGVNGRQIEFVTCDDREDPSENIRCAQRLVEQEEVFGLAGMSTRTYASARYMAENGVPDIAGIPIGNEYYTYPGLYGMYAGNYTRDGVVGDNGTLYWGTYGTEWLTSHLEVTKAAVFYYNIAISKEAGQMTARVLREVGLEAVEYEINPALPNFDSRVIDMEQRGVEIIMHAMDEGANLQLCRAMERRNFQPTAVVPTIAGWNEAVGAQFPDVCRPVLYVWGNSHPSSDTSVPEIALFRDTMRRVYGGQFDGRMHQWHFEGWLGAKLFIEGVERMGANVTRRGLMDYMESLQDYTWDGLVVPTDWQPVDWQNNPPTQNCSVFARWSDDHGDFIQIAGVDNCGPTRNIPYEASA